MWFKINRVKTNNEKPVEPVLLKSVVIQRIAKEQNTRSAR